jgi:hypothetical protein
MPSQQCGPVGIPRLGSGTRDASWPLKAAPREVRGCPILRLRPTVTCCGGARTMPGRSAPPAGESNRSRLRAVVSAGVLFALSNLLYCPARGWSARDVMRRRRRGPAAGGEDYIPVWATGVFVPRPSDGHSRAVISTGRELARTCVSVGSPSPVVRPCSPCVVVPRDPHDPLITRGSPFANVSDQKHNIACDTPPSQSRPVRAQF